MPTTKYLWDDVSDTVVMEKDGSGNTQAVYHTDPTPFGKLNSMRRGGKTYNYHFDAQGNSRALTENGQITDTYRYLCKGQAGSFFDQGICAWCLPYSVAV